MREESKLSKLIVILGPTAVGKTAWAIRVAKKIGGQIIGADSRQIFKKMEIGTAKPAGEWRRSGFRKIFYVDDIPHYIIDMIDPGKTFSVAEFRDRAIKNIKIIQKIGDIPIIVGGTGLYISSIVDNLRIPRVEPNKHLRMSLEEKSLEELFLLLQRMDIKTAKEIDRKNKRRIIRALEVCILSGKSFSAQKKKGEPLFDVLQIGIDVPREELYARINTRVDGMIKQGLVKEVQLLVDQKYPWNLSSMSGVGYRQFKTYFEGIDTLDKCIELLKRDTRRFARRQMTWFRRNEDIQWCSRYEEAEDLIEYFLLQ